MSTINNIAIAYKGNVEIVNYDALCELLVSLGLPYKRYKGSIQIYGSQQDLEFYTRGLTAVYNSR